MSGAKVEPSGPPGETSSEPSATPSLEGRVLGYARVSTDGQSLAAQLEQLRAAGAGKVYRETASGAKRDRAQLARLLREVEPGDVVLVTRLNRLARSTRDLLNVLAALAEFERELIRSRTGEGRARAKANGVKMGRPHKLTPHQQREARQRRQAGETVTAIARSYAVHHATISRLCG